ncbi:MAG: dipeptidase [Anaerolineae bacterium]|nr:dipeptidase [Anaerolineae bacterium]
MDATTTHQESIVIDGHCDTLLRLLGTERRRAFAMGPTDDDRGHIDLPRLKAGGVTAQNFACFVSPRAAPGGATHETLALVDQFHRLQQENADELCLATRAADIERAKGKDMIAGILSMEGAEGLEGDLAVLRMVYRLGVRWVGLTWSLRNQAGDGVAELRTGGGLTEFGVRLVAEMNRLGMVVDIAHLAPAGVRDVFEICEGPVVASHANAHAVCPVPRNLTDEQLEGVARSGGVVGAVFCPPFITDGEDPPTLDMLLDHIDHMVSVMGADHVGIGSDFDGFFGPAPVGLEDVSAMPNITAGLLARGYGVEDVRKILGGNWLRVFREVVG